MKEIILQALRNNADFKWDREMVDGFQILSDNFDTTADDIIEAITPILKEVYNYGTEYGIEMSEEENQGYSIKQALDINQTITKVLNKEE